MRGWFYKFGGPSRLNSDRGCNFEGASNQTAVWTLWEPDIFSPLHTTLKEMASVHNRSGCTMGFCTLQHLGESLTGWNFCPEQSLHTLHTNLLVSSHTSLHFTGPPLACGFPPRPGGWGSEWIQDHQRGLRIAPEGAKERTQAAAQCRKENSMNKRVQYCDLEPNIQVSRNIYMVFFGILYNAIMQSNVTGLLCLPLYPKLREFMCMKP